MKRKRVTAWITSLVMICSLFVGFNSTVSADTLATVRFEAYRATDKGDFGEKLDLSSDKLAKDDEVIIAVQMINGDKILGTKGLSATQIQVIYDSAYLQQAMVKSGSAFVQESNFSGGIQNIAQTDLWKLAYIKNQSNLWSPNEEAPTIKDFDPSKNVSEDAAEYDKELMWMYKSAYSPAFQIKKKGATTEYEIVAAIQSANFGDLYNPILMPRAGEDNSYKKMLLAYKFKVKEVPANGELQIKFNTADSSFFKIDRWNASAVTGNATADQLGYTALTGTDGLSTAVMNPVTPLTLQFEQEPSGAPTATLGAYTTGSPDYREVEVTAVTGETGVPSNTVINVYDKADAATRTKLGDNSGDTTQTKVKITKSAAAANIKALNLGEVYVSVQVPGKGESTPVKVNGTARPNKTNMAANKKLTGTAYKVPKDGVIDDVTPALPASADVAILYNPTTGLESGNPTGTVKLTNWVFKAGDSTATDGATITAQATIAKADAAGSVDLQTDIDSYKVETDVTVQADAVTKVEAVNETATYSAKDAYNKNGKVGVEALKDLLNENEKVVLTYETAGEQDAQATTWTLKADQTYDPKQGTYVFESETYGGKNAQISVTITPVTAAIDTNATADTLNVSGLDADLELIAWPADFDALNALLPTKTTATFTDEQGVETTEDYTITWTAKTPIFKADGSKVADGSDLGTVKRVVNVPAWLTTDPALSSAAEDIVNVKVSASVMGVKAVAANFPSKVYDMIRIKDTEQDNDTIKKLVAKEGTVIEFYSNNTADDATPVLTYTVTAADAAAKKLLIRDRALSIDFPTTASSKLYVGVNVGGTKTKAVDRTVMNIDPEPAVSFTNSSGSLYVDDTQNQGVKLTGSAGLYNFDPATIQWASDYSGVMTVTAKTDKMTALIRAVGEGQAALRFSGKVNHPFAADSADPIPAQLLEISKNYTVSKKSNGGGGGRRPSGDNTGTGGVVVVPDNKTYFDDIDNVSWAKDKINALASKGILNGVADRIFAPDNTVTRAEFAKMIVGAFGIYDNNATMSFADTNGQENEWYYKYVASAAKRGIILGYEEDNTFRPDRTITREEMCTIVARACKATGRTLNTSGQPITFADEADIMGYAKDAVDQMTRAGILNGMGDNMFVPKGNATRAQAAKVIYDVTQ